MVRPKTYTDSEQIAILHAVLMNKDILEAPKTKNRTRTEAWRVKWEEIAATTDAYFGTNRGATSVRSLYTHWKAAARRKHSSIQTISLNEQEYEASLTMAERILRQICPDIFRKFGDEPTTSNDRGTGNAINPQSEKSTNVSPENVTDDEEQSEPELPSNSNNGIEANPCLDENKEMEIFEARNDVVKDSEDLEEFIERAKPKNVETKNYSNPELPVLGNSDLDGLVLSLQSMVDIPSEIETAVANNPAIFENNRKMDDDIGEIVDAIKEFEQEKRMNVANDTYELNNEDAGPSLKKNETINTDEPLDLTKEEVSVRNIVVTNNDELKPYEDSKKIDELVTKVDDDEDKTDEKKIEETKMDIEENAELEENKSDEKSKILNESSAMPEFIPETNDNYEENSDDTKEPLAESSINVAAVEKRKKKQRGRAAKKRKVTKDSSTD